MWAKADTISRNRYLDPTDPMQHSFMIIGGEPKDRADILDLFIPVFGPEKFYYQTDETTANSSNTWRIRG